MLNVGNINKNVEMLNNVDTKIKFVTQIIFFFDKEFKKSLLTHVLPTFILSSSYHYYLWVPPKSEKGIEIFELLNVRVETWQKYNRKNIYLRYLI